MLRFLKRITTVILFITGIIFVFSCSGSGNQRRLNQGNSISAYDSAQGRSYTYTKYELPLSIDVYKFLKSKKYAFNDLLMHKLKAQDKYFTDLKRAFALGIYSSDLAYTAVYEQSQEAVEYFSASIELAHKLNIQDGYNSSTLDRAYENIDNEDSLAYIVGESYWRTCSNLEKNKRDNILPMVVIGSWIESMHILTRACIDSPPESDMFNELFLQMKHLEKLIAYTNDALNSMENSDSKIEISKVAGMLNPIQEKYQLLDGKNPSDLSLSQFKDIIFLIENLRNTMID
jgi:hypothetical protein